MIAITVSGNIAEKPRKCKPDPEQKRVISGGRARNNYEFYECYECYEYYFFSAACIHPYKRVAALSEARQRPVKAA